MESLYLLIKRLVLGLVLSALCFAGNTSYGQSSFFSSSPGDLSKEHASLDNSDGCNTCHVDGTKAIKASKCLDCHDHKDLKVRIDANKGFHSSPSVKGKACDNCHLEHKGRGFNQMAWQTVKGGEKNFNHALAGWKLQGKHSVLDCADCHKKKNKAGRRTYLGEDKLCGSCHKNDQPHGFTRKRLMACERCHSEVAWKPTKRILSFDHNKKSDAEFPQEGAHKDVACSKCHPKAKFNLRQSKPGNCGNSGCHASPHAGHLFDKKSCDWCHSPKLRKLKDYNFNHKARTRFSLDGAHGRLDCYRCHTKSKKTRVPKKACASCHANDNPHKNRFKAFGSPPACENCHPESSWKPSRFNHAKKGKWPLKGKHARVSCRDCHRGKKPYDFEKFPSKIITEVSGCRSCHEHKDVHPQEGFPDTPPRRKKKKGALQTCVECHKMAGVKEISKAAVKGIHGSGGSYPLTGGHAGVKCGQCHINDEFKDTPKQCGTRCHQDSLHEGALGDSCDKCHKAGTWKAVFFNHDDDTEWPLLGLHKKVPKCSDCHPQRVFSGTPTGCAAVGCHAEDDAHNGKLGKKCEECHLETGETIFDHNSQSDYPLTGKHLTSKCVDCHPSIEFKPRPKDCFGDGECHPEPKVHEGQYGTVCETCHTTDSFTAIKPLHDVGAFSLKGAHDRLACETCHPNNKPLAGTGNLCITCHRQDDVHANSLSPSCGNCHTQWSFAPARFDHNTVGCNLSGFHRTLPCADCHQAGNYRGLVPTCYSCHRDSSIGVNPPDHANFGTCGDCHNPNTWSPATGFGRESICR